MSEYIKALNTTVSRKKVCFVNRYGIELVGDLYYGNEINFEEKHAALIIGAPYGGVKEQGPCVYAGELAQRGFVVLTFDAPYMGESEGFPRRVSSPDFFVESFSAAVDFLGLQPYINREKIGVIGICGSGGFALAAAQVDTRIKAVAVCSMYDMSKAARLGMDAVQVEQTKEKLSLQRWVDAENGYPEYIPAFPEKPLEKVPDGLDVLTDEWFRFYAIKRGHHPNALGGFTTTSNMPFMNVELLHFIDEISPRPILFVIGDRAHSKFYSEDAYKKAKEPKELYVVTDAEHIDLYDRVDKIPFEKLELFFKMNLQ